MKFTQIPADTFKTIQLNAGMMLDDFNPATGEVGNILGATTGGNSFEVSNEFKDYGDDIDNCPKNTMELKKLDSIEAKMSGTFVTISAASAKLLAGAADIDAGNSAHIIPRRDVLTTDFKTIWWVGDYSDDNDGEDAGFIAIRMRNTLSTGGFKIQSSDKGKGNFAYEFTAHFSMANQNLVPYDIYVVEGGSAAEIYGVKQLLSHITSNFTDVTIEAGDNLEITLTPDTDYEIATVIVTMGGENQANAFDDTTNKVTLENVSGNVEITAVATYTGA